MRFFLASKAAPKVVRVVLVAVCSALVMIAALVTAALVHSQVRDSPFLVRTIPPRGADPSTSYALMCCGMEGRQGDHLRTKCAIGGTVVATWQLRLLGVKKRRRPNVRCK